MLQLHERSLLELLGVTPDSENSTGMNFHNISADLHTTGMLCRHVVRLWLFKLLQSCFWHYSHLPPRFTACDRHEAVGFTLTERVDVSLWYRRASAFFSSCTFLALHST